MMIAHIVLIAVATTASPYRPLPESQPVATAAICPNGKAAAQTKDVETAPSAEGIANLPFAMGRRFRRLDDYLEHLRCNAAPIDLPWWREIRPGVYQRVKRMRGAPPEVATRAELMKRFGFAS